MREKLADKIPTKSTAKSISHDSLSKTDESNKTKPNLIKKYFNFDHSQTEHKQLDQLDQTQCETLVKVFDGLAENLQKMQPMTTEDYSLVAGEKGMLRVEYKDSFIESFKGAANSKQLFLLSFHYLFPKLGLDLLDEKEQFLTYKKIV